MDEILDSIGSTLSDEEKEYILRYYLIDKSKIERMLSDLTAEQMKVLFDHLSEELVQKRRERDDLQKQAILAELTNRQVRPEGEATKCDNEDRSRSRRSLIYLIIFVFSASILLAIALLKGL